MKNLLCGMPIVNESQDDDINKQLAAIANYINESNKLFEQISDKNVTYGFLVCLRTSYERLKNYSYIVGCKEICGLCIEKIADINRRLELLAEGQEMIMSKRIALKRYQVSHYLIIMNTMSLSLISTKMKT